MWLLGPAGFPEGSGEKSISSSSRQNRGRLSNRTPARLPPIDGWSARGMNTPDRGSIGEWSGRRERCMAVRECCLRPLQSAVFFSPLNRMMLGANAALSPVVTFMALQFTLMARECFDALQNWSNEHSYVKAILAGRSSGEITDEEAAQKVRGAGGRALLSSIPLKFACSKKRWGRPSCRSLHRHAPVHK